MEEANPYPGKTSYVECLNMDKKRLKVLMVDSLVGNDYSLCLCSSLKSVGVDILLVVPQNRQIKGLPTFRVLKIAPSKGDERKLIKAIKYAQYLVMLLVYIIKVKPDVVHFQFFRRPRMESLYFAFLKLIGTKLVYTVHNVLPHEQHKIDQYFNNLVYRCSTLLIAHSEFIRKQLYDHFKIESDKIRTIAHGDFDIYLPRQCISQSEARKVLGLNITDDVILFFGHIREYKGLDLLLGAFEIAAEKNKDLILLIAGSPYTKELEKRYELYIAKSAHKNRIIYHGEFIASENVPSYFISSDVVVLPYTRIYHSGVLHLAYSFGRSIIATKVGDFEEVMKEDRTGYLVEAGDESGLARMIVRVFRNKDELEKMGKLARELSESKYCWAKSALSTKEMYEEVSVARN